MFVKKFSADTLDEALKTVKKELGPDAIILKTTSHKGAKGFLKKKKIEITAAVTEREYVKKTKVDAALPKDVKENFYNSSASSLIDSIDDYNHHLEKNGKNEKNKNVASRFANGGYGNLALNKMVKHNFKKSDLLEDKSSNNSNNSNTDLDLFLNSREINNNDNRDENEYATSANQNQNQNVYKDIKVNKTNQETPIRPIQNKDKDTDKDINDINTIGMERIIQLEKKISKLTNDLNNFNNKKPQGLYNIQTNLRCLDISEKFIQYLNKRMCFELTKEELDDYDATFDFSLREILNQISCEQPLFSKTEFKDLPSITVLVSGKYSGQTSTILKLQNFKKNSMVIAYKHSDLKEKHPFASKVFNINIKELSSIAEVVSECRKAYAENKSVFIDYKNNDDNQEDTRLFLDSLKRSFENIEILLCISAIHSEKYNQKIILKHRDYLDGIIVTYLDICSNFGEVFNINYNFPNIPFKFFSTGNVIPDDIELASAERIISGLFEL